MVGFMNLSKDQVTESLRMFVTRRDDLLHEDEVTFDHHLRRFIEFCQNDPLVISIIHPLEESISVDVDDWWSHIEYGIENLQFPSEPEKELLLQYRILVTVAENSRLATKIGFAMRKNKRDEAIELFRTLVVRPFANEVTHRLGQAANLATPEERALQAVPISRIPNANEIKIFLSHKSVDKPLVFR